MKLKNILIAIALLLLAFIVFQFLDDDVAREDLGKITLTNAAASTKWCVYKVEGGKPVNEDPLFYKKGDIICITCIDNSTKSWPPKINGQQICYTDVRFTTADGQAIYDLTLQDITIKHCYTCPKEAKGYYIP